MGFYNALNACFTLHELNHSHWAQVHENGYPIAEEDGIPNWKDAPPIVTAVKDKVRADRSVVIAPRSSPGALATDRPTRTADDLAPTAHRTRCCGARRSPTTPPSAPGASGPSRHPRRRPPGVRRQRLPPLQHRPDHQGRPGARGSPSTSTSPARKTSSATSPARSPASCAPPPRARSAHARRRRAGPRCGLGSIATPTSTPATSRSSTPSRRRPRATRPSPAARRARGARTSPASAPGSETTDAADPPARSGDRAAAGVHDRARTTSARILRVAAPDAFPLDGSSTRSPTSSTARCSASTDVNVHGAPGSSDPRLRAGDASSSASTPGVRRPPTRAGRSPRCSRPAATCSSAAGTTAPGRRHRRGRRRVPRRLLPLLREQGPPGAGARRAGDAHRVDRPLEIPAC